MSPTERRADLFLRIAALCGPSTKVVDAQNGWPGLLEIALSGGPLLAAVHVGPVGRSHRDRDDVERRFQNPGQNKVVSAPQGALPLIIGLWEEGARPVLVGMEAAQRLGRPTRQSLFVPLWMLKAASEGGWAEHTSTSGELIIGFQPALFSTYAELRRENLTLAPDDVLRVVEASGMTAPLDESAEDRARRASQALVRDARFGRAVVRAYEDLCAMCGLDLGLVQGAHIYPVRAPASPDAIWNGLALCSNHHLAFDRHLIWVDPASSHLKIHPTVMEQVSTSDASRWFVESTQDRLRPPTNLDNAPRPDMFVRRYRFFEGKYEWADSAQS